MSEAEGREPGLLLRAARRTDRERWLEAVRDPVVVGIGAPAFVQTPLVVDELDDRVTSSAEDLEAGRPGTLVVADETDDRLCGIVSWRLDLPPVFRTGDIGYLVHPAERGRGVATAAVRRLSRWLTDDPQGPRLLRVQLDHSVENPASCRVALAAGFEREGVRRGYLPMRDADAPDGVRRHDVCLHGLLADP